MAVITHSNTSDLVCTFEGVEALMVLCLASIAGQFVHYLHCLYLHDLACIFYSRAGATYFGALGKITFWRHRNQPPF